MSDSETVLLKEIDRLKKFQKKLREQMKELSDDWKQFFDYNVTELKNQYSTLVESRCREWCDIDYRLRSKVTELLNELERMTKSSYAYPCLSKYIPIGNDSKVSSQKSSTRDVSSPQSVKGAKSPVSSKTTKSKTLDVNYITQSVSPAVGSSPWAYPALPEKYNASHMHVEKVSKSLHHLSSVRSMPFLANTSSIPMFTNESFETHMSSQHIPSDNIVILELQQKLKDQENAYTTLNRSYMTLKDDTLELRQRLSSTGDPQCRVSELHISLSELRQQVEDLTNKCQLTEQISEKEAGMFNQREQQWQQDLQQTKKTLDEVTLQKRSVTDELATVKSQLLDLQTVSDKHHRHKETILDLKKSLQLKTEELEKSQSSIDELQHQLDLGEGQKKLIRDLRGEIRILKGKLDDSTTSFRINIENDVLEEFRINAEDVEKYQKESDDLKILYRNAKARIIRLETEIKALKSSNFSLTDQLNALRSSDEPFVESSKGRMREFQRTEADLKREITRLKTLLKERGEQRSSQPVQRGLSQQLLAQKGANDDLREQNSSLKKKLDESFTSLTKIRKTVMLLEGTNQRMEQTLRDTNSQLVNSKVELNDLANMVRRLTEDLLECEKQKSLLREKHDRLEAQIRTFKGSLQEKEDEIARLKGGRSTIEVNDEEEEGVGGGSSRPCKEGED